MKRKADAFIFGGLGLGLISILLTKANYYGGGFRGILHGDKILDSGLEARWPLALSVLMICWGLYHRLNSN